MLLSELLSVSRLQELSGVSRFTWRTWIREGRLPVVRLGRRVLVKAEDYENFLADSRTEAK